MRLSSVGASAGATSRLRNAAQSWVMAQDQITCIKRRPLEISTIAGNEEPMIDLVSQYLNGTNQWEVPTQTCICRIDALRENQPDPVVLRRLGVISQHQDK